MIQHSLFEGFIIVRDSPRADHPDKQTIYFEGMRSDGDRRLRSFRHDSQKALVFANREDAEQLLCGWDVARTYYNYRVESVKG